MSSTRGPSPHAQLKSVVGVVLLLLSMRGGRCAVVDCPDFNDPAVTAASIQLSFLAEYSGQAHGADPERSKVSAQAAHRVYLQMVSCKGPTGKPMDEYLLPALAAAPGFLRGNWDQVHEQSLSLQYYFPNDALGALAEAEYWYGFAWDARGGNYSDRVSNQGFADFTDRLTKAKAKLIDSKPYASTLSAWYDLMIKTQGSLGEPSADLLATLHEGAAKFHGDALLYTDTVRFLLPKWGGNWHLVETFAHQSAVDTRTRPNAGMYASIYGEVDAQLDRNENLFADTEVNWPDLKRAMDQLARVNQNDRWGQNYYASLACRARDKTQYLKIRRLIADNLIDNAWRGGASADLCDARFDYQE